MKQRSEVLDIGRGLASSYVVWHHVQIGLFGAGILANPLLKQIDNVAGVWRMPFFFLMAGIFLPRIRSGGRTFKGFLILRASTVLWPFVLWMTVQNMVIFFLPSLVNNPMGIENFLFSLLFPPGQFWFLQMLLIVSLFLAVLDWKIPRILPWLSAVAILISAILIKDRVGFPYHLSMALGWGALGVYIGRADLERLVRSVPLFSLGLFAVVALSSGWWTGAWWTGSLVVSIIGGCLLALWAGRIMEGTAIGGLVALIGRNSLKVYLLHLFFCAGTRIFLIRVAGVSDPFVHAFAGMLSGTFGVVVMSIWLEKRDIRWPFRFPLGNNVNVT